MDSKSSVTGLESDLRVKADSRRGLDLQVESDSETGLGLRVESDSGKGLDLQVESDSGRGLDLRVKSDSGRGFVLRVLVEEQDLGSDLIKREKYLNCVNKVEILLFSLNRRVRKMVWI